MNGGLVNVDIGINLGAAGLVVVVPAEDVSEMVVSARQMCYP